MQRWPVPGEWVTTVKSGYQSSIHSDFISDILYQNHSALRHPVDNESENACNADQSECHGYISGSRRCCINNLHPKYIVANESGMNRKATSVNLFIFSGSAMLRCESITWTLNAKNQVCLVEAMIC